MDTIQLDAATALRLLREVVAERPDYVYDPPKDKGRCVYVYNGRPSCLIGHVLVRAGIPLADVAEVDGSFGNAARNLHGHLAAVTEEAGTVLDAAQVTQDGGGTWASALSAAERRAQTLVMSA